MALAGTFLSLLQKNIHFRRCFTRGVSLGFEGNRPRNAIDSGGSDEMGTVLYLIMELSVTQLSGKLEEKEI